MFENTAWEILEQVAPASMKTGGPITPHLNATANKNLSKVAPVFSFPEGAQAAGGYAARAPILGTGLAFPVYLSSWPYPNS